MKRPLVLATILAALAARAQADPADPGAAQSAGERTCTTVTTVVKRGEVVLSSTSTTRCEGDPKPGGGPRAGDILKAPAAALGAVPDQLLKSLGESGGDRANPKNVRGDWRWVEPGSNGVCRIFLTSQATDAGLRVRTDGCHGPLKQAANWRFDEDAVVLYRTDGGIVVRLHGRRDALQGDAEDGSAISMDR